jgi:hypothetical protein
MRIDTPLALRAAQLMVSLLLVTVAVNVAILVYARTATRTGRSRCAAHSGRRGVVWSASSVQPTEALREE